ncbi:MAG TPA: glycoside hydrolase family 16 protein [Mycobacteriales bacterium]|nr:glycoside hydrolase family 16 protein [Mycobacteriales bacterium]
MTSRRRVARLVLPVLLALLCVPAALSAGAAPSTRSGRTAAAAPAGAAASTPANGKKKAKKKTPKKKAPKKAKKPAPPPGWAPEPLPDPSTVLFDDEFSGAAGDAPGPGWQTQAGPSALFADFGSEETNTSSRANSRLDGDGHLLITAVRSGSAGSYKYTSARLITPTAYGPVMHVTARIKMPDQRGTWPIFWLMGGSTSGTDWPRKGEIDIAEVQGSADPEVLYVTAHGAAPKELVPGVPATTVGSTHWKSPSLVATHANMAAGFHNYGVDITADRITWTFDHKVIKVFSRSDLTGDEQWSFSYAMHVILNLSVGGSFVGNPPDDDVFPTSMVIDYVRITH